MEDDSESISQDVRVQWIVNVLRKRFRHLNPRTLNTYLESLTFLRAAKSFVQPIKFHRRLLFHVVDRELTLVKEITNLQSSKSVFYLVKHIPGVVTASGISSEIIFGDVTLKNLAQLDTLLQEVFLPILMDPDVRVSWGELVSKNLLEDTHRFLSDVKIVTGHIQGRTVLPLPESMDNTKASSKDQLHVLEGCLITWTHQIKFVLAQTPESTLENVKENFNAGPMLEVKFWRSQTANLNYIFEQLQSTSVRKVLKFLDKAKSTYNAPFAKLCKEVFSARAEAVDSVRFVNTLEPWFKKLEDVDLHFLQLADTFKPIMHLLLLIWKNSRYYNKAIRLVVVLREVCNAVISKAVNYLSGDAIFSMIDMHREAAVMDSIKKTIEICGLLRSTFFEYKSKAIVQCPSNPWNIQNHAIFSRLDALLDRCHDVLEIVSIIVNFSVLETATVGGSKGKVLSTSVGQIYADFLIAQNAFRHTEYDLMDIDNKSFSDDFFKFRSAVKEQERRLSSVVVQAFEDAGSLSSQFRLLESFGDLLQTQIIGNRLENKKRALLVSFAREIETTSYIFRTNCDNPTIRKNLPPVAGAINWCRGLVQRIYGHVSKLRTINPKLLQMDEAQDIIKSYTALLSALRDYETEKIKAWGSKVKESSQKNLDKCLLRETVSTTTLASSEDSGNELTHIHTEKVRTISVNFDPDIIRLLREVKYFKQMKLKVMDSALRIYENVDVFRIQTSNLALICSMYNKIQRQALPVEKPLIQNLLQDINSSLERGLQELNWKGGGIDAFIDDCMEVVVNADRILSALQTNYKDVRAICKSWIIMSQMPKPERAQQVKDYMQAQEHARTTCLSALASGGKSIHKLLRQTSRVHVKISQGHESWRNYAKYINRVVFDGIVSVVTNSLEILNRQLNPRATQVLKLPDMMGENTNITQASSINEKTDPVVSEEQKFAKESAISRADRAVAAADKNTGSGASFPVLQIDLQLENKCIVFHPPLRVAGLDSEILETLTAQKVIGDLESEKNQPMLLADDGGANDDDDETVTTNASSSRTSAVAAQHKRQQQQIAAATAPLTIDEKIPPEEAGLLAMLMSWISGFFATGRVMRRVDTPTAGNYVKDIQEDPNVTALLAEIADSFESTVVRCNQFSDTFQKFEFLWDADFTDIFNKFLESAYFDDEIDAAKNGDGTPNNSTNANTKVDVQSSSPDFTFGGRRRLNLEKFSEKIAGFQQIETDIEEMPDSVDINFLRINANPMKQALNTCVTKCIYTYAHFLYDDVIGQLQSFHKFCVEVTDEISEPYDVDNDEGNKHLMRKMSSVRRVTKAIDRTKALFEPLWEEVRLLQRHNFNFNFAMIGDEGGEQQPLIEYLEEAPMRWDDVVNQAYRVKEDIQPYQKIFADKIRGDIVHFQNSLELFLHDLYEAGPFNMVIPQANIEDAYQSIDRFERSLFVVQEQRVRFAGLEDLFELPPSTYDDLDKAANDLLLVKNVWDMMEVQRTKFKSWHSELWDNLKSDTLIAESSDMLKCAKALPNRAKKWLAYQTLEQEVRVMTTVLPIISDLKSPSMQARHWDELMRVANHDFEKGRDTTLDDVLHLNLQNCIAEVKTVIEVAAKEARVDKKLQIIESVWGSQVLLLKVYKSSDIKILQSPDETVEFLEEHQLQLQSMIGMGRFVDFFRERVLKWRNILSVVEVNLELWLQVQHLWVSLESIFLNSSDIRSQLPDDTKRFEDIDGEFRTLMRAIATNPLVVDVCTEDGREVILRDMAGELEKCQKSLNEYLDVKKSIFPRFCFVSNTALLDILSNGNNPPSIVPHLSKCFNGITSVTFDERPTSPESKSSDSTTRRKPDEAIPFIINAFSGADGETVPTYRKFKIAGAVEEWLHGLLDTMKDTLRHITEESLETAANWEVDVPRHEWLYNYPAQVAILASQIFWTEEVEGSLDEYENGQLDAVRTNLELCNTRLSALIELVCRPLGASDRTKINTMITVDVHARDVVQKLVDIECDSTENFAWHTQMRFIWDEDKRDVESRIANFQTLYSYEYIGNVSRLVITPLTDKCYITLSMALRLNLGAAPAGPAGTGKTETTKDLSRALGIACYVFNCSDQMNYQTMASNFKGLAQTGAWGCFDEFNRIHIEVLSVVAAQVSTILEAIGFLSVLANRSGKFAAKVAAGRPPEVVGKFDFFGDKIRLIPTCGFFITMNPGYAGRTTLPENLKALFRSCAMIRPDLQPICQNMMMAEGFQKAPELSVKFVTVYKLSSELLSAQKHYDWGLRAMKSILTVAGVLKRENPDVPEELIIMRSLRDFNAPKIPNHDMPIFLQLFTDLFPGLSIGAEVKADMRAVAEQRCKSVGLVPDPELMDKVVQLDDLLNIRHSVMILGCAGAGKTTIWRLLHDVLNMLSEARVGARGDENQTVDTTNEADQEDEVKNFSPASRPYKNDSLESFAFTRTTVPTNQIGQFTGLEDKRKCIYDVINPKAITSDELFGHMSLSKEWRDGVLSILMRAMSQCVSPYRGTQAHQWVVLDGDIDSIWIESMNTLMDDNKVLTLVSNERITLTHQMRMLFEVHTLDNATPATVSRAAILYVNKEDIGWTAILESWVASRPDLLELNDFLTISAGYVENAIEIISSKRLEHVVPVSHVNLIQTVTALMEELLNQNAAKAKDSSEIPLPNENDIQHLMSFCIYSAFGGTLLHENGKEHRKIFSECWRIRHQRLKIPREGFLFEYFWDVLTHSFVRWEEVVPVYRSDTTSFQFGRAIIPTAQNERVAFLLDLLVQNGRPVMMAGPAGSGKTLILQDFLDRSEASTMRDIKRLSATINCNYCTDSASLQAQLESCIDKRSGRIYGPPSGKQLLYFIDDLNMPFQEEYGTQTSIALLRQYMDYGSWYDRTDLTVFRKIQDVQFITAMNPRAGSFTINPRLQRHFSVICIEMPDDSDLGLIYRQILEEHFLRGPHQFSEEVTSKVTNIVQATVGLYHKVSTTFVPSVSRFHYNFNLREFSAVMKGICRLQPDQCTTAIAFGRLWVHECARVFGDRLSTEHDLKRFTSILHHHVVGAFPNSTHEELTREPLVFTPFNGVNENKYKSALSIASTQENGINTNLAEKTSDGNLVFNIEDIDTHGYFEVTSFAKLQTVLDAFLGRYNEHLPQMRLVIFSQAAQHVARITRILSSPNGGGNAMLVGVGGSGKQSLCRLAAFICGYSVTVLPPNNACSMPDFIEQLKKLYLRVGVRPALPVVLLMNETEERFLVHINEILSSGTIPDLFTPDELEQIFSSLRPLAKAAMVPNTPKALIKYFMNRVRDNLHVVLCFSPIGDRLRTQCNHFPALINCSQIDWFHPWPKEALVRVANRHLNDVPVLYDILRDQAMWASQSASGATTIVTTEEEETVVTANSSNEATEAAGESGRSSKISSQGGKTVPLQSRKKRPKRLQSMNAKQTRQTAAQEAEAVIRRRAEALRENVAFHMAEVHVSVKAMSDRYHREFHRYNYCTPKTFLEFISFYVETLKTTYAEKDANIKRLRRGVTILAATRQDVSKLREALTDKLVQVDVQRVEVTELLQSLGEQQQVIEAQHQISQVEREKCDKLVARAHEIQVRQEKELEIAKPALAAAKEAVDCLDKNSLAELKSFKKPPPGVDIVTQACLIMLTGETKNFSWLNAKKMMSSVDTFLNDLKTYDGDNIPRNILDRVIPLLQNPSFNADQMRKKSKAAANLCNWVVNIIAYHQMYVKVKPLVEALDQANADKASAEGKLKSVENVVAKLTATMNELKEQIMLKTSDKAKVEAEATKCKERLSLAERLTIGLKDEYVRWGEEIRKLEDEGASCVGDCIADSACISYIAAFNQLLRQQLFEYWTRDLQDRGIPMSPNIDALGAMMAPAAVAQWVNEGLQSDSYSLQNAAVVIAATRWPLLIDPQEQGVRWILKHEEGRIAAAKVGRGNVTGTIIGASDESVSKSGSRPKSAVRPKSASKPNSGSRLEPAAKPNGESKEEAAADSKNVTESTVANAGKPNLADESSLQPIDENISVSTRPHKLVVLEEADTDFVHHMIDAVFNGDTVVLKNVGETIHSSLTSILQRAVHQRGAQQFVAIGDSAVEYHSQFRLYLQTKLSNPHFKPEIVAQCTLVNFSVTEEGLEEQLLAKVVSRERSELEEKKRDVVQKLHNYKMELRSLENQLLERLANAPSDILSDVTLIEGLEFTKLTAKEVGNALEHSLETEQQINESREVYRPVAKEGALGFFILLQLPKLNHMYQVSLDSFETFFFDGMDAASRGDEGPTVIDLCDSIRQTTYMWVTRGLLETHKPVYTSLLLFKLLENNLIGVDTGFDLQALNFLLLNNEDTSLENPASDWLPDKNWNSLVALRKVSGFEKLPSDLEENPQRFREWYNMIAPESEKLPLEWRNLEQQLFRKLLVIRCLRPDRLTAGIQRLSREMLGKNFTERDAQRSSHQILADALEKSAPQAPVFFILSQGSDVAADMDKLARDNGLQKQSQYLTIALGQGQGRRALQKLRQAMKKGYWLLLHNLHLMPSWLPVLQRELNALTSNPSKSHPKFRLFLSSNPNTAIPAGLLSRSLKLTNEPPSNLMDNVKQAVCHFDKDTFESMDNPSRGVLFGLCYFHALMVGRKKFGPIGFNSHYQFSLQDLQSSFIVLRNYMEHGPQSIPWQDLQYLFGEIMYGGHIINDLDRTLCSAYMQHFMTDRLLDEMEMFPFLQQQVGATSAVSYSFKAPPPSTFDNYLTRIDQHLPEETPMAYGLHPNAEIGYRTNLCNQLCKSIFMLMEVDNDMSRSVVSSNNSSHRHNSRNDLDDQTNNSAQNVAAARIADLLDQLSQDTEVMFDIEDIESSLDMQDIHPFENVLLQECLLSNKLIQKILNDVKELRMGLNGELTMTKNMERLGTDLAVDMVPLDWSEISYPTQRSLPSWLMDLKLRIDQLKDCVGRGLQLPMVTWISGLFNPVSFLTAVLQTHARATNTEFDRLTTSTEVLKRQITDISSQAKEGNYLTGLHLEGARWDVMANNIVASYPKQMFCKMPVVLVKAAVASTDTSANVQVQRQTYMCPVYRTTRRCETYVFTANLKTKAPPAKWVMAGVALLMDVEG